MILYQFRKKAKRLILDNFNYAKIRIQGLYTKPKGKSVFIDITEIETNRYLSNLIKFFKINGYTVYLPNSKSLINKLCRKKGEFKYASFILNGDVKIGIPKNRKNVFFLAKEQLSNDYFNKNLDRHGSYYVPMSQYPLMYANLINEEKIDCFSKRKRSVFMAGNFNPEFYAGISGDGFFEILSRREIMDFVYNQSYYHQITSYEKLVKYIEEPLDFKVLLIDHTQDFNIKIDKLKEVLKQFDFFMALPGILIPQSHNLIEAMEMGCIPIIHKTYADLLYPPLQHYQSAIIYETKQELDIFIKEAFEINEKDVINLRENVLQYYKTYLCPKAVVDTIITNNYSKIILQAETISLNLLKQKRYK